MRRPFSRLSQELKALRRPRLASSLVVVYRQHICLIEWYWEVFLGDNRCSSVESNDDLSLTPTRTPRNVLLHTLSYTVQWSSDETFGTGSGEAKVSAPYDYGLDPNTWMTYTIDGLTAAQPTYVRVMASNAVGFSEPAAAVPQGWSQHEVRRV